MSNVYTQLRYPTGGFQALQQIVLAVFGAVDSPFASCMLFQSLEITFK